MGSLWLPLPQHFIVFDDTGIQCPTSFGAMWARDLTQGSLRILVHPFLKPRSSSLQAVLLGWRLLCVCVHYDLFAVARFSVDFDTQQFFAGGLVWKVSVVFEALHMGVVLPSEPLPIS